MTTAIGSSCSCRPSKFRSHFRSAAAHTTEIKTGQPDRWMSASYKTFNRPAGYGRWNKKGGAQAAARDQFRSASDQYRRLLHNFSSKSIAWIPSLGLALFEIFFEASKATRSIPARTRGGGGYRNELIYLVLAHPLCPAIGGDSPPPARVTCRHGNAVNDNFSQLIKHLRVPPVGLRTESST